MNMKKAEKVLLIPEDKYSRMLEKINDNETKTLSVPMDTTEEKTESSINHTYSTESRENSPEKNSLENLMDVEVPTRNTEQMEIQENDDMKSSKNKETEINSHDIDMTSELSDNEFIDFENIKPKVCKREKDLFVYRKDLKKKSSFTPKKKFKWVKF